MATENTGGEESPKISVPTAATNAAKKSSKLPLIVVGVIVLLVAGLFAKSALTKSANEKTAENIIEKVTGNKVNLDASSGSYSVTDKETGESATVGTNQKLPSDFPKDDVPYLKEKSVTLVISSTNDGKKNWSVTTVVNESLEAALAFFESKIKEPDFTDVSTYGYNDTKTFSGKSVKYDIIVTVSKLGSDGGTSVTYVIEQN